MSKRPVRSPPSSPIKPPERCPYCYSPNIRPKGSRPKKLETVRLYICRACDRRFTPGPRGVRNKTYPLGEILEALTAYNQGHSLEDAARRLSSRYGHSINPRHDFPLAFGASRPDNLPASARAGNLPVAGVFSGFSLFARF